LPIKELKNISKQKRAATQEIISKIMSANTEAVASSSAFVSLLGETLKSKDGTVKTADAIKDKYVALYFSAHWCPPCRGFTPKLSEWYTKDLKTKGLEVVFVSSDKGEKEFDSYYGEQPWLALPYEDRERKAALSKQFKVQGIPTLVILDKDGSVITTKGRGAVSEDPTGENLPWHPPTFEEALGNEFVKADGSKVTKDSLKGKYLGVYFSAHWCGPCRNFTPKLAEWYKNDLSKKNFEIIFVSSDRDQASFDGYLSEMPWLALPFSDRARKGMLSDMFDVEGIPTFAIVGPDGKIVNSDGRSAVSADPTGKEFPWYPKPVNDLSSGASAINDLPSLCVLMEKASNEKKEEATKALEAVAKPVYENAKVSGKDPDMAFFTCTQVGGLCARLREMTKLGDAADDKIQLIIMDIPDNGGYYVYKEDVADVNKAVSEFYSSYRAGSLTRQQL